MHLETRTLPIEATELRWLHKLRTSAPQIPSGFMALYFLGRTTPVLLVARHHHIFGRGTNELTEVVPTFDISTIYPQSLTVSRRHLAIKHTDEGCQIQDLDSKNGTWLNLEPLEPYKLYPLPNGSRIQMGNVLFYLFWER